MKSLKESKSPIWTKYIENYEKRKQAARKEVLDNLENDEWWDLFKKRLDNRDNSLVDHVDKMRDILTSKDSDSEEYKSQLSMLQIIYLMSSKFICDNGCEYNGKPRRGARKFTTPRKFFCKNPSGTSIEDYVRGGPTPPECLDVENNLCPNYYIEKTSTFCY